MIKEMEIDSNNGGLQKEKIRWGGGGGGGGV